MSGRFNAHLGMSGFNASKTTLLPQGFEKERGTNMKSTYPSSTFLTRWCIALAVTCLVVVTTSTQGAIVTWGTPTTITGDTDVITTGSLVAAYDYNEDAGSVTINTVTFTTQTLGGGGLNTFTNDGGPGSFGAASGAFAALTNDDYKSLLSSAVFANPTPAPTFTFNGLTIGSNYIVQVWVNNSGSANAASRTIGITAGNTATLDQNNAAGVGGVGEFVVGTFTADAATQVFTVSSSAGAPLVNAAQVRLAPVPEPASVALIGLGSLLVLGRRNRA